MIVHRHLLVSDKVFQLNAMGRMSNSNLLSLLFNELILIVCQHQCNNRKTVIVLAETGNRAFEPLI